ncbi:hypothetical protein LXL04_010767 [Taraxacum kok-saghyz]
MYGIRGLVWVMFIESMTTSTNGYRNTEMKVEEMLSAKVVLYGALEQHQNHRTETICVLPHCAVLGSFENSYIPENPRTPPISYISQTIIPFKKPTSEPSKTFIINKIR